MNNPSIVEESLIQVQKYIDFINIKFLEKVFSNMAALVLHIY